MSDPRREVQVRWGQLRKVLREAADRADGADPEAFAAFGRDVQVPMVAQIQMRLAAARRLTEELRDQLGVES